MIRRPFVDSIRIAIAVVLPTVLVLMGVEIARGEETVRVIVQPQKSSSAAREMSRKIKWIKVGCAQRLEKEKRQRFQEGVFIEKPEWFKVEGTLGKVGYKLYNENNQSDFLEGGEVEVELAKLREGYIQGLCVEAPLKGPGRSKRAFCKIDGRPNTTVVLTIDVRDDPQKTESSDDVIVSIS